MQELPQFLREFFEHLFETTETREKMRASVAYQVGWRAAEAMDNKASNPYPKGTFAHRCWALGYKQAVAHDLMQW